MDKYIGRKLDGRYEITELIGVGGMADVYKATDMIDNKTVAVKILKREYAENEEFLRRFRNESKMIASLSHPNVVKVYDVGFSNKLQFIVMEYINGITLKEYIENEEVLTWQDSVHFVIQVLRALQHAHDKGIVHRDIKPQNIMMFEDGTIKVMDFGIAKSAREQAFTATDQTIGTVHYISPEQARGDQTDEKSDIYSVGVMFYEMLTGRKPFDSDKPVTIAVMHMKNMPKRPRAINPDIPAGLEEIILRAMEKDPENRYQTASDMIKDIESFKSNPSMVFGYYEEVADELETTTTSEIYLKEEKSPLYEEENYDDEIDDDEIDDDETDDDEADDDETDDDDEEGESRSLFIPVMTAVTIAFIVVAVFFILWLVKGVINGGPTTSRYEMPNLVGMDYYEAKDAYTYLDIQINETENSTYEKDLIYFQDIAVGDTISTGQTVYVNVSLGVSMVQVPDVKNYHYDMAKKMLEQEKFVVEQRYEMSSEGVETSMVIRTEPAAGEEAEAGSTIIMYISKGIENNTITIQNLVGKTIEEAKKLCEFYGLVVIEQESPSTEDENIVIAQSIEENQVVDIGTEITLTYSNGQDPTGVVPFSLTLPENATGRFVLDFLDSNGTTLASTSTINAAYSGSSVNTTVEGSGVQQIVVILSNYATNKQVKLGVYNFDFTNLTYSAVTEDIQGAFEAVDGINHPTEAPTDAPVIINPVITDPAPMTDPIIQTAPDPIIDNPEPVVTQAPEPSSEEPIVTETNSNGDLTAEPPATAPVDFE
ncbi:MAG: Stk1 family PASTA domain-containing Ser/Thr kinase [Oscillospiraceae bacterium]|nr:Stk1 family PASTA domain-containing Ser/Thr kinase [Oscillospiraceae bacterium]